MQHYYHVYNHPVVKKKPATTSMVLSSVPICIGTLVLFIGLSVIP